MTQQSDITVNWSSRLELLADNMFAAWRRQSMEAKEPFAKFCVVVNDMATRDWLKQYYLLDSKQKRVLMNMEFVTLSEMVNDWLAAEVQGISPQQRRPGLHPYSRDVLAWRIYGILERDAKDFQPLQSYIGSETQNIPRRRYALSEQLAKLYDDYLNSRCQMLRNWETGAMQSEPDVPQWQLQLYRKLLEQDGNSYAGEYAAVIGGAENGNALANGFPKYLSINVFDIPFMSHPTLCLLERMQQSLGMPLVFWTFNPCGDWLAETKSKREMIREMRKQLRDGMTPSQIDFDQKDAPQERLLSALASGARAVIGAQCDDVNGDVNTLDGDEDNSFVTLGSMAAAGGVALHSCYSPRRELEALKDGLHHFFAIHKDAKPHDALVLCADWDAYAPIVESVFSSDNTSEGYIPITIAGGIPGDTPLTRSFSDILEFRRNRFEVSAVFGLLGVFAIRERFGIDENGVDILRDMVKKANIHWGLDDAQVSQILGVEAPDKPYPFTWRRGLDRLAVDMLVGGLDDEAELVSVCGDELLPCGNVEGERARAIAALHRLIDCLAGLRKTLQPGKTMTAAVFQEEMLKIVETFYQGQGDNVVELSRIRQAITSVAESVAAAGLNEAKMDGEVFVQAMLANIRNVIPGSYTPADAVLMAPLKTSTATPHKFVWICGLNDGKFPRNDRPVSFNVVARHPSLFDVTSRERDAFALLKACLGAREQLVLSYVGHDIHSNESIPPSVLLSDLTDYFKAAGLPCKFYDHPLQAYSPRYFQANVSADKALPPSYSNANLLIAKTIQTKGVPTAGTSITAFTLNDDGDTVIAVDDLADFYSRPNNFLMKKRLGIAMEWLDRMEDNDAMDVRLDRTLVRELIVDDTRSDAQNELDAKIAVEQGGAPAVEEALAVINGKAEDGVAHRQRQLTFNKENKSDSCPDVTIDGAYMDFINGMEVDDAVISIDVDGHSVKMPYRNRMLELQTQGNGPLGHTFVFVNGSEIYSSEMMAAWVRHIAGHAAGYRFATVMLCQKDATAKTFRPMAQLEAQEQLMDLVRAACNPLPPEYPDFIKASSPADDTPFRWEELNLKKKSVATHK